MADEWDRAEEEAKKYGGGNFVKLENDKDKVIGAFCGNPHTRKLFWNNTKNTFEPYTDEHKKAGEKASLKVSLNIYVIAEGNDETVRTLGEPKMKIIEGGVKWFKSILKAKKKYGLDKKNFEVERNGDKGDTKTVYSILPEDDISTAQMKAMKKMDLHDLEKAAGTTEDDAPGDSDMDSYDKSKGKSTDPIEADDADRIAGVLRNQPKDDVIRFLSKFGIKRIKSLTKGDLDDALAFIKEFEEPATGGGDEEDDDVDPFGDDD